MTRPFSPVQIWKSFLKIIPYFGVTFAVVLGTICLALLLPEAEQKTLAANSCRRLYKRYPLYTKHRSAFYCLLRNPKTRPGTFRLRPQFFFKNHLCNYFAFPALFGNACRNYPLGLPGPRPPAVRSGTFHRPYSRSGSPPGYASSGAGSCPAESW